MKNFDEILDEMRACSEAREWASDKDFQTVWATCYRGDWMAWLVDKVGINKRLRVLVAGHCANTVRDLMRDDRSRNAVDVCIRYGNGEATEEELRFEREVARDTASVEWVAASDTASNTASEAAWAASEAASGAASKAARAAAWAAASTAVSVEWAAASEAARAAAWAAINENLQQTADIIRKYITSEMMIEKLEILYP